MNSDKKNEPSSSFYKMFDDVSSFLDDLMKNNELLRNNITHMEAELRKVQSEANELQQNKDVESKLKKIEDDKNSLQNELTMLHERLDEVEKENKYFAEKYVEIQKQNDGLASLYVASYQLHSTLDMNQVLTYINEIVINLIGTEEFGLYLIDDKENELVLITGEGVDYRMGETIKIGEGIIGEVAKTGKRFVNANNSTIKDNTEPIAAIKLCIEETPVGVLAIFKLLNQKDGFEPIDIELFELLAGHAATAVVSSQMYAQSKRKLNTLEGFMGLLNPATSLISK